MFAGLVRISKVTLALNSPKSTDSPTCQDRPFYIKKLGVSVTLLSTYNAINYKFKIIL